MTDKPFSAHDLDIDNSNSHISRLLRGKLPPPPTEEEIVERTRRDTYKNILAGLGVDYEEDASATTLLLQVNAEVERAAELQAGLTTEESAQVAQVMAKAARQRDELRDAARAVVASIRTGIIPAQQCDDCTGLATRFDRHSCLHYCDDCTPPPGALLEDNEIAEVWRRLCALVKP